MNNEQVLITRLSLASRLIDAGISAEKVRNPFRPEYFAWIFPKSERLCELARTYYAEKGQACPKKFCEDGEKNG